MSPPKAEGPPPRVNGEGPDVESVGDGRDGQQDSTERPGTLSGSQTYFIWEPVSCRVKIGRSVDPLARLRDLQIGSPTELKLLHVIPSNVERELHSRFADDRLHGEWFTLSRSLRTYLEREGVRFGRGPRESPHKPAKPVRSEPDRVRDLGASDWIASHLGGVGRVFEDDDYEMWDDFVVECSGCDCDPDLDEDYDYDCAHRPEFSLPWPVVVMRDDGVMVLVEDSPGYSVRRAEDLVTRASQLFSAMDVEGLWQVEMALLYDNRLILFPVSLYFLLGLARDWDRQRLMVNAIRHSWIVRDGGQEYYCPPTAEGVEGSEEGQ